MLLRDEPEREQPPKLTHLKSHGEETKRAMVRGAPLLAAIMVALLAIEGFLQRDALAWRPLISGALVFATAWTVHLAFAASVKRRFGVEALPAVAFGAFTTLLGLVFSVLLGQTISYYFARQSAIQDAAFREISAMQRLLELCLDFAQRRKLLTTTSVHQHPRVPPPQQATATATAGLVRMLTLLEGEAASLAPGGDGLAASTRLVSADRALQGVLHSLYDLSADFDAKNDPATTAALNAAQQAVTAIFDARALRVSQTHADLPPTQFLVLNLLGGLLLGAFLLTDLQHEQLEALLFGAIAGVATVVKQVLGDLASPFKGEWSVAPARRAGAALLKAVRDEIEAAKAGA